MSEHLGSSTTGRDGRLRKSVCRACNRTVYVFTVGGAQVETDTELIDAITDARPTSVRVRLRHSAFCDRYQVEAARVKALAIAKKKAFRVK